MFDFVPKQVPIDSLQPHPMHDEIYRDEPSESMIESVRKFGIFNPIVTAADGRTIVSGVLRQKAGKIVGLTDVWILVAPWLKNDRDIVLAMLDSNVENPIAGA